MFKDLEVDEDRAQTNNITQRIDNFFRNIFDLFDGISKDSPKALIDHSERDSVLDLSQSKVSKNFPKIFEASYTQRSLTHGKIR